MECHYTVVCCRGWWFMQVLWLTEVGYGVGNVFVMLHLWLLVLVCVYWAGVLDCDVGSCWGWLVWAVVQSAWSISTSAAWRRRCPGRSR